MDAVGEELCRLIDEAFGNAPYPGDDRLVNETSGMHLEAARIRGAFAGRHWRDLPFETLEQHRSALAFLSPDGFAFYLAAFMKMSVADYDRADIVPHDVIATLTPPRDEDLARIEAAATAHGEEWEGILATLRAGYEGKILETAFGERVARLDAGQRIAIRRFLEYMRDVHGEDFADNAPQIALDRYWAAH